MELFDLTVPATPLFRAGLTGSSSIFVGVAISEQHIVATDSNLGLHVFDSGHGSNLVEVGTYGGVGFGKVALAGNYAIVGHGVQGVTIVDLGASFRRKPTVSFQPQAQRALSAEEVRFDVGTKGTVPMTYQWMFNGTNRIVGATNFVLTIPHVEFADAGEYSCFISNSVGGTSSAAARLEVDFPPVVNWVSPKENQAFYAPAAVTLEVNASDIESTGSVARVEFFAGTELVSVLTAPPYRWTTNGLPSGTYTFTARATDNEGASTLSEPITISVQTNRVFQLAQPAYSVNESNRSITVTVRRNDNSGPATIDIQTLDNTARANDTSGNGQYVGLSKTLVFAAQESLKEVTLDIVDDRVFRGNTAFLVQLSNPSDGWRLAYPSNSLVSIVDDDDPVTANSFTELRPPTPLPPERGSVHVTLTPSEGMWRFVWEIPWRTNGTTATNLIDGDYEVEFLPLAGYARPPTVPFHLDPGASRNFAYACSPNSNPVATGALRITLLPTTLVNSGQGRWRVQSLPGSSWQRSGDVVSGLLAGEQVIEFEAAAGYRTPEPQPVIVPAGQSTNYLFRYESIGPFQPTGPLPVAGFSADIDNSLAAGAPYAFAGQVRTDAGFGSGFVVKERTVLTAAHLVFDAHSLSYVSNVWWFLQKDRDFLDPPGLAPRGWYVMSGYASRRTNEIQIQHLDPNQSTVHSQDQDIAALFFVGANTPARGGWGGYLTSSTNIQWLTLPLNKKLFGYPMENVPENDRGRLHETREVFAAFRQESNQVYSTDRLIAYGGNSGGALCVNSVSSLGQFYLPAAVCVSSGSRLTVRAIDLEVVNLINASEFSGNTGTNSGSGGAIIITPILGRGQPPPVLDIIMPDSGALRMGGAWRISPTNFGANPILAAHTNFTTASISFIAVTNAFAIELRDVDCFRTPTNRQVLLQAGQDYQLLLDYQANPGCTRLWMDRSQGLAIWGPSGSVYRLETTTNLLLPTTWQTNSVTNLNGRINWIPGTSPKSNPTQRFYRAVQVRP